MQLLAQTKMLLPPLQGSMVGEEVKGLGGFASWEQIANYPKTIATIISNIVGFLTIVAGLWFLIQFMLGAVSWISAGGDKGKVKEAKDKITQSVIGLAIVVAAYAIAGLVGRILGLNFLDIGTALNLINPGGAATPTPP